MEAFIFFQTMVDEYGAVAVLFGFVLGWFYFRFRIDGMETNINTRIDGIENNININMENINKSIERIENAFAEHERKCAEKHQQFIDYMEEHSGRISHIEGRLDERQQQPAT